MNEKINIRELATALSEELQITKKDAEGFLRELFNVASEGLMKDSIVKIKDLGTFKITEVSARESVNVRTGERVIIPAHKKVSYSPDKKLSDIINEPYEHLETTELEDEGSVATDHVADNIAPLVIEQEMELPETSGISETSEISEIPEILETKEKPEEISPVFYERESLSVQSRRKKKKSPLFSTFSVLTIFLSLILVALLLYGVYYLINRSETENISGQQDIPAQLKAETPQPMLIDSLPKADSAGIASKDSIQPNEVRPDNKPVISNTQLPENNKAPLKKVTVREGERLTVISLREYGHKIFWVYLYKANMDVIKHPDNVLPGTVIVIPDPKVYGIDKNNPQSIRKAAALAADLL